MSDELSILAAELRSAADRLDTFKCPQLSMTGFGVLHAAGWPVDNEKTAIMAAIGLGESEGFMDAVGDYWQVTRFYEVRRGDTLSSIARWLHLDSWDDLYQANISVIGPDPDDIKPGMLLINPGLADNADVWLPSLGIYQIRGLKEPDKYPSGVWRTPTLLRDPIHQARAAWAISQEGENFTPWSVYKNGSYRKYLGRDYPLLVGHVRAGLWPQSP